MKVSDVNVFDEERTWINRVTSEIVFQPLHPDTSAPLHEERVIEVRKQPKSHLKFYQEMSLIEYIALETSR